MPLPTSWTLITVTATYTQRDGDPATGSVVFVSPQVVVVDGEIIVPRSVVGTLDANGDLSVQLPSTDDPDIAPTGWTWLVRERVAGLSREPYAIEVPSAGGPIDLADVAPVEGVVDLVDLANVWTGSQTLRSTFDGGENTTDSTSRLNVESHQRATTEGPFGEILRAFLRRQNAKAMIAWYEDYTGDPDSPRTVAWVGAHGQSNDGATWHNHWSVEVPDESGAMQSALEIPFATFDAADGYGLTQADRYVRALCRLIARFGLIVEGPAGTFRDLVFSSGNRGDATGDRWTIRVNSDAESGSDAGSNFEIVRRNNTGSALDAPLIINRATGNVELEHDLTFEDNNNGPVLVDRTTDARFRLFVDGGTLQIEAV